MEITVSHDSQETVRFTVSGKVDERGAAQLKTRFLDVCQGGSVTHAVFDFNGVAYIGSAGIGKLLLFYKELAAKGGTLQVVNTPQSVATLLRELKLDTILTIS